MPVVGRTRIIDAAGVKVQGSPQGKGAMVEVVVGACQDLHLGLLVEAQSHDVGSPFFRRPRSHRAAWPRTVGCSTA